MPAPEHMNDQQMLEKYYKDQDARWLGMLLQRYTFLLFGVSMKYLKHEEEAKDAVQQVFLKVLVEMPKTKVIYFKSWLYMIVRNHCLMKLRDKGQHVNIEDRNFASADELEERQSLRQKEEMLNKMAEAVNELSAEQKTCITLFYLQKQTYQEIVEKTGFNMMQVKSYIQNGKRNLKNNLLKRLEHER
jgi:RNA polymerase sigma factor (sigma-70 family)